MYTLQGNKRIPPSIFISYAHEDEPLRQQLETHLSLLGRQGLVTSWHDRQIMPGADWSQNIDVHLNSSSIILLLISSNFLASDYCYGVEMQRALERQKNGEAYVVPVLLRPVDLQEAPFVHLQCLPHDSRPVTSWSNLDEAFYDVAKGIRLVVNHLHKVDRTLPLSSLPSWTAKNQAPSQSRTNREHMLWRVRAFWIKGVLEQSLHHAALITLELHEQPDAVANPWHLVLQHPKTAPQPLPTGTRITQVYDDADSELLILGAPGSGKTTLLLELARDLLDRAGCDKEHPMPVVFNLSSWATKRQPLVEWLVEELVSKYQVPHKLGKDWVTTDQVLPLLDGLDEITPLFRTTCIEAINMYRQEHGLVPLVVCSRSVDYLTQSTRVLLHSAVIVQPLSARQVNEYLSSAGRELESVRAALDQDVALWELATTPLMLSILTLAYHGKPIKDLLAVGMPEMRRQQVFMHYIQHMIERRGSKARYKPQQTVRWLALLAEQLTHRSQTQFYIELMQPDWLPGRQSYWLYHALAVKSIDALIGILVGILIGTLHSAHVGAFVYGLVGLLVALLVGRRKADRPPEKATYPWKRFIRITPLFIGAITELVIGLGFEMMNRVSIGLNDVLVNLLVGTLIGLVVGALMGFRKTDIQPLEIVIWSWDSFFKGKHVRNGILAGLVFGTINAVIFLPSGPFLGLFAALAGWLLSGLLDGLSSDILESHLRVVPNQGIRRSARNGLLIGLILGLSTGLIIGLYLELTYALFIGLVPELAYYAVGRGVIYGLGIGLLSWLFGGGDAYIKHNVLRLLLWATGSIPWNYPCFLDYATERILLHKVGGSYLFVHHLLLEYFASLYREATAGNPGNKLFPR